MSLNTTMLAGPVPESNPNFPVTTVATKRDVNEETPTLTTILGRLDQLLAEGKTDGVASVYWNPELPECLIFRNWSTVEVANEWIAFVQSQNDPTFGSITLYS